MPYDGPVTMARPRILLVGGDRAAVAVLGDYLRRSDRYEIGSIEYCDDALRLLQQRPVDLVLLLSVRAPWTMWSSPGLPARLSGETGVLFLKQMRSFASPPPVIVLSATVNPQWMEEALANALAFLPMPCKLDEIGQLVANALGPSSATLDRTDRP